MNTNEIVLALRCYTDRNSTNTCKTCPCYGMGDCFSIATKDGADEIERLQKELDAAVEDMHGNCKVCKRGYRQTKIPCANRTDLKIDTDGSAICDFEWRGLESEGT